MAKTEFKIERAFLERLERLTIHWQKSFSGIVGGHNTSRYSGPGQEFLDHRNFGVGDDLRAVNWRAYMRLEKLFLKLFTIEPRVPIRLFLDASESMALGGQVGLCATADGGHRLRGAGEAGCAASDAIPGRAGGRHCVRGRAAPIFPRGGLSDGSGDEGHDEF